jgi:hypothetical protein
MHARVKTGYEKYVEDSEYGLTEYNTETEFSTPISITNSEFDLMVPYRADGLAFQEAIDNRKDDPSVGDSQADNDIDEDIFMIDAVTIDDALKTRQDEGFQLIGGLYGDEIVQANIRMAPTRNMIRWGDWLNAAFSKLQDRKLMFQKTEGLSTLRSQLDSDLEVLYETKDYDINKLPEPKWSGRIAEFDAPLTREQINQIISNPYGLVKFWNYHTKEWIYGWIKECSTDRVDRDTTWKVYEAANLQETANNLVYVEDGEPILLMSGDGAIKTNA